MDAFTLISGHEGLRLKVYKDNDGSDTIGYGIHLNILTIEQKAMLSAAHGGNWQNIYQEGITTVEADILLRDKITALTQWLNDTFPWFKNLSETRQAVLIDMTYELGEGSASRGTGIMGFKHFLAAMAVGNWQTAVQCITGTRWAKQVPNREKNDAVLILQG